MYQSFKILHDQHVKKGHLQLMTKQLTGEFISNFFVTSWISTKFNYNKKGHVLPTLIQFHVQRTSIVEFTFNKNSWNVWHQTLTSLQLLEKALQLVLGQLILLAYHPGHLPNTL